MHIDVYTTVLDTSEEDFQLSLITTATTTDDADEIPKSSLVNKHVHSLLSTLSATNDNSPLK